MDRCVWGLTTNGISSTASTYSHLTKKLESTGNDNVESARNKHFIHTWFAKIPNKIKVFVWVLLHKRLKTN